MLEFNTALEKDVLVIELEGALDSHSAADFRRYFQDKTGAGYRAFALDCLCLEYISSAGIAAIIDLQSQLQAHGGKMVLFQLATESRQLLRFLKLEDKLTIVNDYDDAVAALTGYRRVIPASDIVAPEELRIIDQNTEPQATPESQPAAAAEPATETVSAAAIAPKPQGNEMLVEEHFAAEKKGLHPVHAETETVAAQAPAAAEPVAVSEAPQSPEAAPAQAGPASPPQAVAMPEAQELKLNTGAKRLISCPNCKSVLRVAVAGDYLCPACRFRFAFKASA
ncbi:MAG: STAS domain-containing protein [Spirochaetota bacterium]